MELTWEWDGDGAGNGGDVVGSGEGRVISEEARLANAFGRVARPHAPGASPRAGGSSHIAGWWSWGGSCVCRVQRGRSGADAKEVESGGRCPTAHSTQR
jgi:hypothetical protein